MSKPKKDSNDNFYKIRNTETGLYSTGGSYPHWTKVGKTWTKIGHLKCHLNKFESIPDTWEVVELEQRPCSTKSATEYFRPVDRVKFPYETRRKLAPHYTGNVTPAPQAPVNVNIQMPSPAQMAANIAAGQAIVNQIMGSLGLPPTKLGGPFVKIVQMPSQMGKTIRLKKP